MLNGILLIVISLKQRNTYINELCKPKQNTGDTGNKQNGCLEKTGR